MAKKKKSGDARIMKSTIQKATKWTFIPEDIAKQMQEEQERKAIWREFWRLKLKELKEIVLVLLVIFFGFFVLPYFFGTLQCAYYGSITGSGFSCDNLEGIIGNGFTWIVILAVTFGLLSLLSYWVYRWISENWKQAKENVTGRMQV